MRRIITLSRIAIVLAAFVPTASAFGAAFSAGDLVVTQIGATGSGVALTNKGTASFLHEYTTTGTSVQTLALPTTASGPNNPLTISGTGASEGALSLSSNGAYLVVAGYDVGVGGNTQNTSTVGLVGVSGANNGVIDTSTTTALLSGNNTRAATSQDGSGVWVTGPTGLVYETKGSSTGTTVDTHVNYRDINIVPAGVSPTGGDELFGASNNATKPAMGISDLAPAIPTGTGATATILPGMSASGNPSSYAFFFANPTTLFVADTTLGLQEWTLNSGTWTNVATLTGSFDGLTGVQNGGTVTLYATTSTSAAAGWLQDNSLVKDLFTFNTGTSGTGTFGPTSILATATGDSGFAGVQLLPTPEPATGLLAALGLVGFAFYGWRRRRAA